jgi:rhodanese-related sulfurtransferase
MKLKTLIKSSVVLLLGIFAIGIVYAEESEYRSPESVDGAISTSLEQARALYDQGAVFVDVRNPRLYAKKHIPGAFHLDLKYNFDEEKLGAIAKKDQPIVIYCSGVKCSRSYRASEKAVSWGYTKVHYFRGGIVDWKKAGYPVEVSEQKAISK